MGIQVTVRWKTFAWNRNNEQVSSGKWSVLWGGWAGGRGGGVPQMSSPRNLSSNNLPLPVVDGSSVADCRAISSTSPQMCPWQPEHCKSCYPFMSLFTSTRFNPPSRFTHH